MQSLIYQILIHQLYSTMLFNCYCCHFLQSPPTKSFDIVQNVIWQLRPHSLFPVKLWHPKKLFLFFFMQIRGTELHVKYNKLKQIQIKQKKIKNTKLLKSSPDLKRPGLRPGRAAEGGRRGHRGNRPCRCGGSCDWNKLFIIFFDLINCVEVAPIGSNYLLLAPQVL